MVLDVKEESIFCRHGVKAGVVGMEREWGAVCGGGAHMVGVYMVEEGGGEGLQV